MDTGKPDIISVIVFGLSALAFLITYLRASINKSNRDIDQSTIASLKENNDALAKDRDMWKARGLDAEGQNKILQNMVTGRDDITRLTKTITAQHSENTKWQKQSVKLQTEMIGEFKTFVERHDDIERAARGKGIAT